VSATATRRGHALVGTTIFLVLGMMLWAAVYQETAGHLRAEKVLRVHRENALGVKRAMAWSLALLETGKPSVGVDHTYACRMAVEAEEYVAVFTRIDWGSYEIHVRPKVGSSDDFLPMAPEHF
jgi:hypothetical protein